ncbi:MAG: GAF domain-containing protein [Kangiellaceae bacterium]|nr:GAF domain-containing protein [Kangiellaceae bacterium]
MFDQSIDVKQYNADKVSYYQQLNQQLESLLSIERNMTTNMAQTAAFIFNSVPDLNWTGFYCADSRHGLILGPYQGKVACVHIAIGKGVCGSAAARQQSVKVDDVNSFDGHIACDAASQSEIVIPLLLDNKLVGVLDIDSPTLNRFDENDLKGLESLAATFIAATDF